MPKITKSFIDSIKPTANTQALYWDINLKGFGVRVSPAGKIAYIVQGRVKGKPDRFASPSVRMARGPRIRRESTPRSCCA